MLIFTFNRKTKRVKNIASSQNNGLLTVNLFRALIFPPAAPIIRHDPRNHMIFKSQRCGPHCFLCFACLYGATLNWQISVFFKHTASPTAPKNRARSRLWGQSRRQRWTGISKTRTQQREINNTDGKQKSPLAIGVSTGSQSYLHTGATSVKATPLRSSYTFSRLKSSASYKNLRKSWRWDGSSIESAALIFGQTCLLWN